MSDYSSTALVAAVVVVVTPCVLALLSTVLL